VHTIVSGSRCSKGHHQFLFVFVGAELVEKRLVKEGGDDSDTLSND